MEYPGVICHVIELFGHVFGGRYKALIVDGSGIIGEDRAAHAIEGQRRRAGTDAPCLPGV